MRWIIFSPTKIKKPTTGSWFLGFGVTMVILCMFLSLQLQAGISYSINILAGHKLLRNKWKFRQMLFFFCIELVYEQAKFVWQLIQKGTNKKYPQ